MSASAVSSPPASSHVYPPQKSCFFHTPALTEPNNLAILHLKRDSSLPVTLKASAEDGYAEGAVLNTRFGSFPHSTLIGREWGSQVRASKVDTGTRGRKGKKGRQQGDGGHERIQSAANNEDIGAQEGRMHRTLDGSGLNGDDTATKSQKKRKFGEADLAEDERAEPIKRGKQSPSRTIQDERVSNLVTRPPVEASSGFIHILPPTPEAWTSSLDHRTQVVYTPDYSYILQRLRVRPGSTIVEAGAGSGSFTHAAARAVFSGYPDHTDLRSKKKPKLGKIFSYEFHEQRVQTLRREILEHGLNGLVELTHRDVCNDGFILPENTSPNTDAIFLDLPAPWLALRHLTRANPSALNPESPIQLCTFSPCIEQVQATVSHLRKAGWTEIEMVEVQNRHIDVRREQVGLHNEGLRGVNASAASVEEALARLREVESKLADFHASKAASKQANSTDAVDGKATGAKDRNCGEAGAGGKKIESKAERLQRIQREAENRKPYIEGNLVHRLEPELKTHTSYLVFAILPREWSEANEQACLQQWPVDEIMKVNRDVEGDTLVMG